MELTQLFLTLTKCYNYFLYFLIKSITPINIITTIVKKIIILIKTILVGNVEKLYQLIISNTKKVINNDSIITVKIIKAFFIVKTSFHKTLLTH